MIPDYFSCQITFLNNPVQKHSRAGVFTRSLENSPVTLFCAKIISLRPPCLLFSLLIFQAIDQPHLDRSHSVIKVRFGSLSYWIKFLHVKQNDKDCTGSTFVPPADAEQYCTELLEQSISDSGGAI